MKLDHFSGNSSTKPNLARSLWLYPGYVFEINNICTSQNISWGNSPKKCWWWNFATTLDTNLKGSQSLAIKHGSSFAMGSHRFFLWIPHGWRVHPFCDTKRAPGWWRYISWYGGTPIARWFFFEGKSHENRWWLGVPPWLRKPPVEVDLFPSLFYHFSHLPPKKTVCFRCLRLDLRPEVAISVWNVLLHWWVGESPKPSGEG